MDRKPLTQREPQRASSSGSLQQQQSSATSSSSFALSRWNTTSSSDIQSRPLGLSLLHSSPDPQIDFVFVHGLGGHSVKTWSKTSSVDDFWPQVWLPEHPALEKARIHSFGYIADIKRGKDTCFNVHHFAKNLLGELDLSPHMEGVNTPIVLVAHSMGGLLCKKAYLMARQDPAYQGLGARIQAIVFLATPHQGCNSAKLLNDILQASSINRLYVRDLEPSSGSIQSINDDFRHYSVDLALWSFYETQKLSIGRLFSKVIVDPGTGVLGYPQEKQMPMNADHRSITKFESRDDPNYHIVRNALASIASTLSHPDPTLPEVRDIDGVERIKEMLKLDHDPEHDLMLAEDARLEGTCDWFLTKKPFVSWKQFEPIAPTIFWLRGNPAAGKSILSGSIIGQLRHSDAPCSFSFFKYGHKKKSQLSYCLRTLAYQMACASSEVCQRLVQILEADPKLDYNNERTIWRRLFVSGIFTVSIKPQYWLIDGLDECSNPSPLFEFMLAKLDESIPLRIFITSRETPTLESLFIELGRQRVFSYQITVQDTLPDIRLLAEAKCKSLLAMDDESRQGLAAKVVAKSWGSFLWTILVFKELASAHGIRARQQVLEDVPPGMEALYRRTLDNMSSASQGKALAKAILSWVTCARRPLTVRELEGALQFDANVNDTFEKVEESITAKCGQLVTIDRFQRVQIIHATAREFLLQQGLVSEFAIDTTEAHTRIARSCLTYLNGSEFKPPRGGRRPSAISIAGRMEFSKYACENFSSHLARASPVDGELLGVLNAFLGGNILSWIEYVASTHNLEPLVRTAKNLSSYLDACSLEISPLLPQMQILSAWTVDLIRIAAKFSDALLVSSAAIYTQIPAFCPEKSAISRVITQGRRISVVGLSNKRWDDRLVCFEFHQGQATALTYGDKFFAIGLHDGTIKICHSTTCQEHKILNHGENIRFLHFKPHSNLLASCGMNEIRVWDIQTGNQVHSFAIPRPSRPVAMTFDQSILMVAFNKCFVASWDIVDGGNRLPDRPWRDSEEESSEYAGRPPCAIAISLAHKMLAVAYSGKEITLWDLEEDFYYGTCGKKMPTGETSTHPVTAMVFNPNRSIELLAVSYLDGELAILDPFQDEELQKHRASCHTLAASPDGQFLAGGGGSGVINIFEFDSLNLVYRVNSSTFFIKQLSFSMDGSQLLDIRGKQLNVWGPSILIRGLSEDNSSDGSFQVDVDARSLDSDIKITCMAVDEMQEFVICGKSDGSVAAYDLKSGSQQATMYRHKSSIRSVTWVPRQTAVLTVDASNRIFAWKLGKKPRESWKPVEALFKSRLDCIPSITQLLPSGTLDRFLLSTRDSVHLWNLDGKELYSKSYDADAGARWWISHPTSPLHVIGFDGHVARICTWDNLKEVASYSLNCNERGFQLKNVLALEYEQQASYLVELMDLNGAAKTRDLDIVRGTDFAIGGNQDEAENEDESSGLTDQLKSLTTSDTAEKPKLPLSTIPVEITERIMHVIGVNSKGQLTYLDRQSWVCSVDIDGVSQGDLRYSRHFFVPYDWFSATWGVAAVLTKKDVVFARGDEIAIVKGGLEVSESLTIET